MIASLTDVCVEYCEAYRCVKMMTVNLCSLDSLHRRIADPGPPTKEEKSTIIIYFWNWVIPRNAFHSSRRSELRRQNAFCLILINEPTNERKTPNGKKQTEKPNKKFIRANPNGNPLCGLNLFWIREEYNSIGFWTVSSSTSRKKKKTNK